MKYQVIWSRRVEKQISKCPLNIQEAFFLLVDDIIKTGPIQKSWRNFSDLGKDMYHCHLVIIGLPAGNGRKNQF